MAPQRVITTLMMLLIPPAGMAGGSAATPMLAAQVRSRWRACRPLQSDSVPCTHALFARVMLPCPMAAPRALDLRPPDVAGTGSHRRDSAAAGRAALVVPIRVPVIPLREQRDVRGHMHDRACADVAACSLASLDHTGTAGVGLLRGRLAPVAPAESLARTCSCSPCQASANVPADHVRVDVRMHS